MQHEYRRGKARDMIDPGPVHVVCGSTLCRLRVWDEAEWAATPLAERPTHVVPGLGWDGADPIVQIN